MAKNIKRATTGAITKAGPVGPRQFRFIASSGVKDLAGDILVPQGCRLDAYRKNPVILASHNSSELPVARCVSIALEGNQIVGLGEFAPEGVSAKADEACRLVKAGILKGISVGFIGHKSEPLQGGGCKFTDWTITEISCVSIPCNPEALVTEKSAMSSKKGLSLMPAKKNHLAGGPLDAKTPDFSKMTRREVEAYTEKRLAQIEDVDARSRTATALRMSAELGNTEIRRALAARVALEERLRDGVPAHQMTPDQWKQYAVRKLEQIRSMRDAVNRATPRYDLVAGETGKSVGHTFRGSSLEHTSPHRTFEQRAAEASAEREAREAAQREKEQRGLRYDLESSPENERGY